MDKENKIEIPFGAYDSELCGFEYTIPKGYKAEIKDGKVIIRKIDSEDEKIISRIKKAVESYWSDEPLDEIFAWVEAQGEHANFRNSIQVGDKVTRNKDGVLVNLSQLNRVAKQDKQKPYGQREECWDCQMNYAGVCKGYCGLKRNEQKPILDDKDAEKASEEYRNFRESCGIKDPVMLNEIEEAYYEGAIRQHKPVEMKSAEESLGIDSETYSKIVDECIFGEQKPTEEVNGEDYGIDSLYAAMDILNKTLGQVEGYQSDDGILEHKAAITAVKKLYKQKPAWSEEDKRIIDNLVSQLCNLYTRKLIKEETKDKYVNWLKSLKDRYTWKPTEEQIEALDHYVYDFIDSTGDHANILKELLEQLKAL